MSLRKTIELVARKTAKKHGIEPDEFLNTCRNKQPVEMSDTHIKALIELSYKSMMTNPDMLEYYLGVSASKVRYIVSNEFEILTNRRRKAITRRQKKIIDFIGKGADMVEIYDGLMYSIGTKKQIQGHLSYMVKKGLLNRERRGYYSAA